MLSFDIYNPETKEWELQDWSDMFEEISVNKITLFNFRKFVEKQKVKNKKIQQKFSISDEDINNVRKIQSLKLQEIRNKQLLQK